MRFDEAFLASFNPAFRQGWDTVSDRAREGRATALRETEQKAARDQHESDQARQQRQFDATLERLNKSDQAALDNHLRDQALRERELNERIKSGTLTRDDNRDWRDSQAYDRHFATASQLFAGSDPEELAGTLLPLEKKARAGTPLNPREQATLDAGRTAFAAMRNPTEERTAITEDPAAPGTKVITKSRVPIPGAPRLNAWEAIASGAPVRLPAAPAPAPLDSVLQTKVDLLGDLMKQKRDAAQSLVAEDTREIAGGDNRTGFLNWNSRRDRLQENEGILAQHDKDAAQLDWVRKNPADPRARTFMDDLLKRYAN